ncbi:uncharacterized protein METZ01_LOCUS310228, partial [marine metagenome]
MFFHLSDQIKMIYVDVSDIVLLKM